MATGMNSEYRERQEYARHMRALKTVKPKLDSKDPTDKRYMIHAKRKRERYIDHYQYRVDAQNEALLERLLSIRDSKGNVDNWNKSYQPKYNKNAAYRKRTREKIEGENKKLLRRLQNSKSFYNKSDWDKGYIKHQKYLAILGKRTKPWRVRAYRETGSYSPVQNSPKKKRKLSESDNESEKSEIDDDSDEDSNNDLDNSDNTDEVSEEDKLPEIKSANSRNSLVKSSMSEKKDEEPLTLPPINANEGANATKAEKKGTNFSKLNDYEKLVKGIEEDNSDVVLNVIAKNAADKEKLQKLVAKYNENNDKELSDEVKLMFKGDTQDVLLALILPKPNFDAMCLHNELKGFGMDEDAVVEILGSRDNSEIEEIKEAYMNQYGNALEEDITLATSDEYQKFLLRLCEADREGTTAPVKKVTLGDTKKLLKCAKAKTWGTENDEFIEILSQRSHPQIKGALSEYKKTTKCDLEDTLDDQINGDFLEGSKIMLQIVRNRPKYYANKLHDALQEEPVQCEVVSRLLNTCDPAELKAVKAAYQKAFNSTIKDDVNGKCSEDTKKLLLPLLQDDGEPTNEVKKNKRKRPQKEKTEEKQNDEEKQDALEEQNQTEDDSEQSEYHGTVTPAANFDALKDVEYVRGALVYKDRDGVIKRLTSRSNHQRQVIAKKFNIRYKQDLLKLLKSEFGVTMEDAMDALMLPPSLQDARTLHGAMQGMGTKEKDLINIICFRKNKDIIAIKEAYQQEFDRDLTSDVQNETSGEFGEILSLLLEAKRSETKTVKESDVEKDAKGLFEAGEDQLGTDEDFIVDVLTSRSRTHLKQVFEKYQQIADREFLDSMMSELSGDMLKAVVAIVFFVKDPPSHFAEIISTILSDGKTLTRFIASRSEIDMVEVKQAYKLLTNRELEEDVQKKHKGNRKKIILGLIKEGEENPAGSKKKKEKKSKQGIFHPTVKAAKHFSCGRDATLVNESLGVDKDAIIMLLVSRGNKQRQEIRQKYQTMYNKDILADLENEFCSGSEHIIRPLFIAPEDYELSLITDTTEGTIDEYFLMSSLCLRDNEQIVKLKEAFKKTRGKDLADVVDSSTSGEFRTLMMKLLEAKRTESDKVDQKLIEQDAAALQKSPADIDILATRSKESLKATFEQYKKNGQLDILETLDIQLSGTFKKAVVLLVDSIQKSSPDLYSGHLHNVLDIAREFHFCIATRAEIDMVEIKESYQKEFNESLVDAITMRYSDDRRILLHALLNEWKEGRKDITQPPGKAAETKYHPTVLPAASFNALNDAESIYNTQSAAFDMDEVIILLVRRTVKQRREIVSKYNEKYEKDLMKIFQEDLGMEQSVLDALFDDPHDHVVQRLQESTKGLGTNEKLLLEIICPKTNQQLEEIKKAYFEAFKEDICDVVAKDTSGQFGQLLLKILKLERNESPEVSTSDVNEDAKTLYKAGDKRWGTDEEVFVEIFATRSRPHLRAVFKEFKKISKQEITESLNAEMSGDLLSALLLLVSVAYQGELTSVCAELNAKLSEKQDFSHLVVAHSEIDMVEVKEEYKKENNRTLSDDIKKHYQENEMKVLLGLIKEWKPFAKGSTNNAKTEENKSSEQFHPTVIPSENFNPGKDADTLYNAKGKDGNITVILLATRTKEQRIKIKEEYEKKYKTNLLNDVSEQLKIKVGNLQSLFLTHEQWKVERLHDAMKGFGTDEKSLIDILCNQDNKELKALQTAYQKEYGKALTDDIGSETDGGLKDFLLEILKAERRENQPASQKQAVADATALYEAGEKKWGTDETKFIKILITRSRTHLKQVLVEYKKIAKRDLIDSLEDELSGDLEYALIALVKTIARNQQEYSSTYLKESLGNSQSFMACISHRAEIDAVEVKEEYKKLFSTTLASDINESFSGNLSKLMLALIKEWNPEPKGQQKQKPSKVKKDGRFHATVVPVKPFYPVKDAEAIRRVIGRDKNALIDILSSRTIEQRLIILSKYKERYSKANLLKALKDDFGAEFTHLISGMFVKKIAHDVTMLKEATKATSVNEKCLYQILCQRNEQELQDIKQEYKKANGHPLSDKISEVTNGDLKTLLTELLKCERSDVQTVDQKMAKTDGKCLSELGEEKPREAIITIFTSRSEPQIRALLEGYGQLSSTNTLRNDLLDSENACHALVMLASFIKDPIHHSAEGIKKSIKDDRKYCEKIIARQSEIDMVEIKDAYENIAAKPLDEDILDNYNDHMQTMLLALIKDPSAEADTKQQKEYHATVIAAKDFNPTNDAANLKKIKGTENDADKMIALICSRTKNQRLKIKEEFLKQHKLDLLEYLCTTLKVKEKYLNTLFCDTSAGKAKSLYDAMKGFGTDEQVLIDVLCVQNNKALKDIKNAYKQEFGKELSEVVKDETSGDFQSVLIKILQGDRDENQASITSKAKSDAKLLQEALMEKNNTNQQKVIELLTSRSRPHLQKVFNEYKKLFNQEIENSIKKDYSGDFQDCLLALVSSVHQDPHIHWSNCLNQYLNKPQELFPCVTERSEIDMVEIKEEYKNSYNITLADQMKNNYSGNTLKILLALIKESSFSPKPPAKKPAQRAQKVRANKLSRTTTPPPQTNDGTNSLFHGTVVAAKDFDVNKDVKALDASFGKDRSAIILLLSSRSTAQRQEISTKYKEKSKKNLVEVLGEEFQVKRESFVTWLFNAATVTDIKSLHEALEGNDRKEDLLIHILCQRTEEEIQEIKRQYKQVYKKSLDEVIVGSISGHVGTLFQELLKCDRDDSIVVNQNKVVADAKGLHEAGKNNQENNEIKFIETLTSRSYPHLIEVFKEYEKISSQEFEKILHEKFAGDLGNALVTLASYIKDQLTHYTAKLKKTIEEAPDTFSRLVVERCEVDMVEIKELYETKYETKLSDDINKHFDKDMKNFLLSLIKEWSPSEEKPPAEIIVLPDVVYHATVVTSPDFDANKDSNIISEELGKNKNEVIDILTTRTTKQRLAISEVFKENEKEDLQNKLIVELDEDTKDLLSILMQCKKSDAERLHDAMEGIGTNEDVLIDVLCRSTVKDISLIKTEYTEAYGKNLEETVERETSGDINKLLIQLIKCSRNESNSVDKNQVKDDAVDLYKAGEEKVGTDESKFIDIFTTRSFKHLKLLCEHYKEISGKTIEDTLNNEFSGDIQTALLTLASFTNEPLTKYVVKLKETIKDDPKTFCQLIVERSEIDMVEIKEDYVKNCLITLANDIRKHYNKDVKNILLALIKEWSDEERKPEPTIAVPPKILYHPTVAIWPEFVAENDVKSINDHLGSDKDSVVALLTSRTKVQRQEIATAFQQKENKELEKTLVEEFGTHSKYIMSAIMKAGSSDAEKLYNAMKGFGTKENILIEILCRRDVQELMEIKTEYQNIYKEDLEETIKKETSGDLETLLTLLLKCEREEKDVIYLNQVKEDAEDLYQAGVKKVGTEESKFFDIFTSRGFAHLKKVFEDYQNLSGGKTIQESLQTEFTGDIESALITIASYVNDPLIDHVSKLNKTIKDEPAVFREVVIDRCEVDMVEIKELYQKTYNESLAEDIKKHYSDDEKNVLLSLIKEWVPEKQPTIPAEPSIIYHATVLPAENFSPDVDVTALENSFGNSKNSIIALLTTRTKLQRQTISENYKQKEQVALKQKLDQEFGKESEDLLSAILLPSKPDAEKLNDAMKGFGTKENVLIEILCRRTNKEIEQIKTDFKTHTGKDLVSMIESETNGDLEKLLVGLIKCEREEKEFLYPNQIEQDAKDLHEAAEKTFGTDENRFIHMFTRRSFQHLKLLFEQYKKISGKTIEECIEKEFSGDTEAAFKAIVSFVTDPLNSHVMKLNSTIKDDPDVFYNVVVERSEVDMVELKETYLKIYNVTLADDIKNHYTSDVKNFMLALIKEWDPEKEEPRIKVPPPVKYHATVIPAPNFNVDNDVKVLKESLGDDKNTIITTLTTRARHQRQEIREKYQSVYNEDLCHRIEALLGKDLSDTIVQLMCPLAVTDAELLYNAMKGLGTKEEVLISILCRREQEDITAIKTHFKNTYGKDLAEMVDDETSGDLNKLLLELIKSEREPDNTINTTQVEQDAAKLYKAGEKSWGTDESTFIDVFTKRSLLHLRAVFEQYKQISSNDIVTALNKELDGHLLSAFLALVSSARDPPTYYAGLAKQTVVDSPQDFTRLIVERCEIDTVEIKDVYLSVYKKKIAQEILESYTGAHQRLLLGLLDEPWEKLAVESPPKEKTPENEAPKPRIKTLEKPVYHGTIKPAPAFNPKEYAEKLKKAMKGFGTDEKAIIEVLSSRSNQQRRIIYNTYQQEFNKDLIDELKSELGSDMENVTVAMMLPTAIFYSTEINKAVKGFTTDEEILLEIICSQNAEELEAVINSFKREYGKDVNDVIEQKTKGDVQTLLQALLLNGRLNTTEVDLNDVEAAASNIIKADQKWTGNAAVFLKILQSKSRGFLVEMFEAFQKLTNYDIVDVIEKESSGSYKDLLIATVTCIRDPPLYFAKRLYNALDRMNVDDDTLIRCVVGRSEIDLLEIKQLFEKTFSISLEELIKKKCRGDYETMLLAIVNGN